MTGIGTGIGIGGLRDIGGDILPGGIIQNSSGRWVVRDETAGIISTVAMITCPGK
jgi:hypothetical protein